MPAVSAFCARTNVGDGLIADEEGPAPPRVSQCWVGCAEALRPFIQLCTRALGDQQLVQAGSQVRHVMTMDAPSQVASDPIAHTWLNLLDSSNRCVACRRTSCHSWMRRTSWVCRPSVSVSWSWLAICRRSGSETRGLSQWTPSLLAVTRLVLVAGRSVLFGRGVRSCGVMSIRVDLVGTGEEQTSFDAR